MDKRTQLIMERREALAGAEFAALAALCARRGLPSPYGGNGYTDGPDARHAESFDMAALGLMQKAAGIWEQVEQLDEERLER